MDVDDAIREAFTCVNPETNETQGTAVVIAKVGAAISYALSSLGNGNAASSMGAIEFHAVTIKEAAETIAGAIDRLSDAILEAKSK